jgi:hypothetical protein
MTAAPGNAPAVPAAPVAPPVPAAAPSHQVVTQNRAEYGHFNEARLLGITAHAGGDDDQPLGTNALALPSGTNAPAGPAQPRKRKAPDSTVTHAAASKKKKKNVAGEIQLADGTVLRLGPNVRVVTGPHGGSKPVKHKGHSCIQCISTDLTNCDGKAHCNNCTAKCKYVLCELANCTGETCAKIHPWQYNLQARKSGETRRMVIYDNQTEESLTLPEKIHLRGALARVQALRAAGTTNAGESMLQLGAPPTALQVGASSQGTSMAPVMNNGMWQTRFTQLLGGEGAQLERESAGLQPQVKALPTGASVSSTNPWKPHDAQATLPTGAQVLSTNLWKPQNAQATLSTGASGFNPWKLGDAQATSSTRASAFGANPWKPGDVQFTFSTGAPMFSSSTWQEDGAQSKEKGVDRGEPDTGSGSLALTRTNSSQTSTFDLPQAVRNAALKMSAASDAIGLRMGNAFTKDTFSGDPHIKTEKGDDGEIE